MIYLKTFVICVNDDYNLYIKKLSNSSMQTCRLLGLSLAVIASAILTPSAMGQEKYCFRAEIFDVAIVESPSGTGVSIIGNLFNNSSSTSFTQLKIVGELYDASNRLLGVETTNPEVEGMFSPFKIQTSVLNETLDHFILRC